MVDRFNVTKKEVVETREGVPLSISISSWAFCSWKNNCCGAVNGITNPEVCMNYDPDIATFSLKCNNYREKNEQMKTTGGAKHASVPKKRTAKKIRKR